MVSMDHESGDGYEFEQVDEISPGLTCEWYFDKQVIVYRITMVSQIVIETWSKTVIQILEEWDKNRPYLALHDLSKPGVSLQYASLVGFDTTNIGVTASGRKKAEAILDANPAMTARVGVNFSLSLSGQVNKLLADRQNANPFLQYKLFYDRDRALRWLASTFDKELGADDAL